MKGWDALISNNIATSCGLVDGSKRKKKKTRREESRQESRSALDETVHQKSWVNWLREDSTSNKSF